MSSPAERIAVALETIVSRLDDPDAELVARVVQLESIARDFVSIMKNPQSTNQEWTDLLEAAMDALGMEAGVVA